MKTRLSEFARPAFLVFALCAIIGTFRLTTRTCPSSPPTEMAAISRPLKDDDISKLEPKRAQLLEADAKDGYNPLSALSRKLPVTEKAMLDKMALVNYKVILMSHMEVNLVLRYMENVRTYLEWGSGGSTYNFPMFASQAAVSVEHDKRWFQVVQRNIAGNFRLKHLKQLVVPVKKGHKGWGKKSLVEEGNYVAFKEYVDKIEKAGHDSYDFILLDGRARRDAGIKVLSYITDESVVALHDSERFTSPAHNYDDLLRWYTVVDSCGGEGRQGIAMLKRKKEYRYLQGNHTAVQGILNSMYGYTDDF